MSQSTPSACANLMARDILENGARPQVERECILALLAARWRADVIEVLIDEAREIAMGHRPALQVAA